MANKMRPFAAKIRNGKMMGAWNKWRDLARILADEASKLRPLMMRYTHIVADDDPHKSWFLMFDCRWIHRELAYALNTVSS